REKASRTKRTKLKTDATVISWAQLIHRIENKGSLEIRKTLNRIEKLETKSITLKAASPKITFDNIDVYVALINSTITKRKDITNFYEFLITKISDLVNEAVVCIEGVICARSIRSSQEAEVLRQQLLNICFQLHD